MQKHMHSIYSSPIITEALWSAQCGLGLRQSSSTMVGFSCSDHYLCVFFFSVTLGWSHILDPSHMKSLVRFYQSVLVLCTLKDCFQSNCFWSNGTCSFLNVKWPEIQSFWMGFFVTCQTGSIDIHTKSTLWPSLGCFYLTMFWWFISQCHSLFWRKYIDLSDRCIFFLFNFYVI